MSRRGEGVERMAHPLFQTGGGGSIPTSPLAKQIVFYRCEPVVAVELVRAWHSRLPKCQAGPWQYSFYGESGGVIYIVALWHNPSGRCLPKHWIELRRLACAPNAPKNLASRFLGWMIRYFEKNCPQREKAISYQDTACHRGTIYRAAGWTAEHTAPARLRDRSKPRAGTNRNYRSDANGKDAAASAKVRWSKLLRSKP